MTKPKFRIFLDMDGVVVDFDGRMACTGLSGDQLKCQRGAYLSMDPMPGALEGVAKLMSLAGQFGGEVWLATKPPTGVPWAYADKVNWVMNFLPALTRRVILTHDKGLLGGPEDYLVDDRPHRANCEHFPGTLIHFNPNHNNPFVFKADARRFAAWGWSPLLEVMHSMMSHRHEYGVANVAPPPTLLDGLTMGKAVERPAHGGYPDASEQVFNAGPYVAPAAGTGPWNKSPAGRFGGGRFGQPPVLTTHRLIDKDFYNGLLGKPHDEAAYTIGSNGGLRIFGGHQPGPFVPAHLSSSALPCDNPMGTGPNGGADPAEAP